MQACWAYQIAVGIGVGGHNIPVVGHLPDQLRVLGRYRSLGHPHLRYSLPLPRRVAQPHCARCRDHDGLCRLYCRPFPVHSSWPGLDGVLHPPLSERENALAEFSIPLVFDVVAISTYLIVSSLFWYTGMLPDLAIVRDRASGLRKRIFRIISLGWTGRHEQWRHCTRAYLFFAALATPLVISVHSVVSWDFALGVMPGWHSTIFAPYFVAGAIHPGLAMVLTLMIPLRRIFQYEAFITEDILDNIAKTIIFTGLIVGYAYLVEFFLAWYSHNIVEQETFRWRAVGHYAAILDHGNL